MSDDNFVAGLVSRLREAGASFSVEPAGKLRVRPWRSLPAEDRQAVRANRTEIIALLEAQKREAERAPSARPAPQVKPTPEVYAYGQRVTEYDVMQALTALGDEVLAGYRAGRMTKREAYGIARLRLKQLKELRRAW